MQTSQENNSRQTVRAFRTQKGGVCAICCHTDTNLEYLNNMITMCSLQLIAESRFFFFQFTFRCFITLAQERLGKKEMG